MLQGKFRSDLQAQLSAVHMVVPPLRDRRGDIPMLAEHFLEQGNTRSRREGGRILRGFAPDLLPWLISQPWAGNVRELENALAQAASRCEGEWLRARDAAPAAGTLSAAAGTPVLWVARPGDIARLHGAAHPPLGPRPLSRIVPGPAAGDGYNGSHEAHRDPDFDSSLDPNLDRAIMRHIRRVLADVGGNKLRAARLLGISRSTLYRLLDADQPRRTPA